MHPLYSKVAAYCSKAERCPKDVELWLAARDVSSQECEEILALLIEDRFVDEQRYIRAFTADKLRFSQMGPQRIIFELLAKDLPEGLVHAIVQDVAQELDYRQLLKDILRKKMSSADMEHADTRNKLIHWAYVRGFSVDDASAAIASIINDEDQ